MAFAVVLRLCWVSVATFGGTLSVPAGVCVCVCVCVCVMWFWPDRDA